MAGFHVSRASAPRLADVGGTRDTAAPTLPGWEETVCLTSTKENA